MNMKKFRVICLLLAAMLVFSAAPLRIYAAPEETTVPPVTTVAPPVITVLPQEYQGDASVDYGSRTLDAKQALTGPGDYTAKAQAALLYDIGSDTLVFAQDADKRVYPASLTKVMTCLMTLEMQQDLSAMVTVTKDGLRGMEPGGSIAYLSVGEEISVKDLLYCLMVKSANDAASTLATYNSGSIEAFVEKMNERAAEIGCTGTNFVNPHGLHDENHYTTARDMAKIMREAMKIPMFVELFGTAEYLVPATNMSGIRELTTTNYLIRSGGYPTVLDSRVIGGKTGFTTPAGRCLVSAAEYNGTRLICVVMGTEAVHGANRYTYVRYGNFEETSELLDYAYERFMTMQVLNPTQIMGQFPVAGGDQNAFGTIRQAMSASVPLGSSADSLRYEYDLHKDLTAPLKADTDIGVVRVWYGDTCLAQQNLYAATDVAVQVIPEKREERDPVELWSFLIWGIGILVVLIVAGMLTMRYRAIARHRRRMAMRRKAAARRSVRSREVPVRRRQRQ